MLTLDQVKQMEQTGQWQAIRDQVPSYLEVASESEHARLHLSLATALYWTATGADDLRTATEHATAAYSLSPEGSLLQINAVEKLAGLLANLGKPEAARLFALKYLNLAPAFPQFAARTPYTLVVLAHIKLQMRQHRAAISLLRKAFSGFLATDNQEEAARAKLTMVWGYYRLGLVRQARESLPSYVPEDMAPLFHGAHAAVLALENRWVEAREYGLKALAGLRGAVDLIDAAEVCLILAEAVRRLGSRPQAVVYLVKAAEFATHQGRDISTLLLNQRQEGGVLTHVHAASSVGSGGWHPDCWFTTSVA